jgi:hypothetical protein
MNLSFNGKDVPTRCEGEASQPPKSKIDGREAVALIVGNTR